MVEEATVVEEATAEEEATMEEGATLSEAVSRSELVAAAEAEAQEVDGEVGGRSTTEGLSWAAATLRRCSVEVEGDRVPTAVVGSEARSEAAVVPVVAVSSWAVGAIE